MKIFVAALFMVLMGTMFASCLESEGSNAKTEFVTVIEYMGFVTLKGDYTGYTYIPTNPETLEYVSGPKAGSYAKRVQIQFELVAGEEFQEGKTSYDINIKYVTADLLGKRFCNPDTLTNNPGVELYSIEGFWQSEGYITTLFTFYTTSKTTLNSFDMYPEKAEGSTLYVKMNQNEKIQYPTNPYPAYLSFQLPYRSELQMRFPDLQYLASDSINMILVADGPNNTKLETKPLKVKIY